MWSAKGEWRYWQTSRAQGAQGWNQGHQGQARAKERPTPLKVKEKKNKRPEGEGQDGEQAGDGDLGFLCVLGPSADSAPVDLPSARSPGHGPNLGRLHSLSAKLGSRTARPITGAPSLRPAGQLCETGYAQRGWPVHIVGAEPTWIYLPEEPDYSKHVEAKEPESSSGDDPEGEESEKRLQRLKKQTRRSSTAAG